MWAPVPVSAGRSLAATPLFPGPSSSMSHGSSGEPSVPPEQYAANAGIVGLDPRAYSVPVTLKSKRFVSKGDWKCWASLTVVAAWSSTASSPAGYLPGVVRVVDSGSGLRSWRCQDSRRKNRKSYNVKAAHFGKLKQLNQSGHWKNFILIRLQVMCDDTLGKGSFWQVLNTRSGGVQGGQQGTRVLADPLYGEGWQRSASFVLPSRQISPS